MYCSANSEKKRAQASISVTLDTVSLLLICESKDVEDEYCLLSGLPIVRLSMKYVYADKTYTLVVKL